MSKPIKLVLPVTDRFLSGVLTTCIESPFGSHFVWTHVKRDAEKWVVRASCRYPLESDAEGIYAGRKRVRLLEVRQGIQRILSTRMVASRYTGRILLATVEGEDVEAALDSLECDAILQAAVYGKVVFG